MTSFTEFLHEALANPDVKAAYEALEAEYGAVRSRIIAEIQAALPVLDATGALSAPGMDDGDIYRIGGFHAPY